MRRAVPPRQTKVQLHMRDWIWWKTLWEEKSYILQAATTPSKEAQKFYCIHLVWPRKQVFLPNLLWSYFWKWIRLDSTRVLQLSQQQPFQGSAIRQRLPSEPLPIMNSTLSHSTHVRATCNFNTDGLVTTDYLRAKTTDLNILQLDGWPCAKMEYINIRGYHCNDCWSRMIQRIHFHLHIDSSYKVKPCGQFTSARNSSVTAEDNFGYYNAINPLHRCTSGNDSTTQWWFGEQ